MVPRSKDTHTPFFSSILSSALQNAVTSFRPTLEPHSTVFPFHAISLIRIREVFTYARARIIKFPSFSSDLPTLSRAPRDTRVFHFTFIESSNRFQKSDDGSWLVGWLVGWFVIFIIPVAFLREFGKSGKSCTT